MLDLVRQLLGAARSDQAALRDAVPMLKAILYSEALTEIVRATKSPIDDLVLQILRALVPKE